MRSDKVVDHISVLDLVMIARKSAIDRQGIYTEVPTDPAEISIWISNIFRKYLKQLFPGCYIRKNRYSFSVRLDNPMFSQMYTAIQRARAERASFSVEDNVQILHLQNLMSELIRRHYILQVKIRPDRKIFLYVEHNFNIYRNSGRYFYKILEELEAFCHEWAQLYQNNFLPLQPLLSREAQRPTEVQNTPVVEAVVESEQETEEEVTQPETIAQEERTARPIIQVQANRVSEEAQQRFNEALSRVTRRRSQNETAVTLDAEAEEVVPAFLNLFTEDILTETRTPQIDAVAQMLIMVPNQIEIHNNCVLLGRDDFVNYVSEFNVDNIISALNTIELPDEIPHICLDFDNEYVYDVSNSIEASVTQGPDGIYYIPEPIYHVVINGKIVDSKVTLDEAQAIYRQFNGASCNIVLYPITELNEITKRQLTEKFIPDDVSTTEYEVIDRIQRRERDLDF